MTTTDLDEKFKKALIGDFNDLYVPQFTTDWEAQRLVRQTEIDIWPFKRLTKAIEAHIPKPMGDTSLDAILEKLDRGDYIGNGGTAEAKFQILATHIPKDALRAALVDEVAIHETWAAGKRRTFKPDIVVAAQNELRASLRQELLGEDTDE